MARDGSDWGVFNIKPENKRMLRLFGWDRERQATRSVIKELARDGWRPMIDAPKDRYVALFFRNNLVGDFEGACAYILQGEYWHTAHSNMIFDAQHAIAWRPWRKATLHAEPLPSKGRRG